MIDRSDRCPECGRMIPVRSSGMFIAHHADAETRARCRYSLGISSLPDLRAAPTLPSRVDLIRSRAKARAVRP